MGRAKSNAEVIDLNSIGPFDQKKGAGSIIPGFHTDLGKFVHDYGDLSSGKLSHGYVGYMRGRFGVLRKLPELPAPFE